MISVRNPRFLITGKMGSGKDTVADILRSHGYKQFAFAARLKQACALMFPEIMAGSDYNAKRRIWQLVGSEMRKININVFVEALWHGDIKGLDRSEQVVVSDCRYRNEFTFFAEKDFYLLRVEVETEERMRRLEKRDGKRPSADLLAHPSENDLATVDDPAIISLNNDGSVEDLKKQVAEKIWELGKEHEF